MAHGQRSSLRQSEGREASAAPESPAVRLRLLGGFELEVGLERLDFRPHVQRVLAFLALHDGPLRRTYVSGQLWLDVGQDRAAASLRTALWRLRRISPSIIEITSVDLALAPAVVVDASEVAATAARCLHGSLEADDVEALVGADELLPDWYDDWVFQEREHLRHVRLQAVEAACEGLVAAGRYREAEAAALAAVSADPLRETARCLLIAASLGAGNRAEAARQLEDYRARLDCELGLGPSPRLLDLARTLGHSGQ
jgi:DNA-binding SARP family transcriptional activator